jgi:hypothetical protein
VRKIETIEKEIQKYEQKNHELIKRGRRPGAGAGGFKRDLNNIQHRVNLLEEELKLTKAALNLKINSKQSFILINVLKDSFGLSDIYFSHNEKERRDLYEFIVNGANTND